MAKIIELNEGNFRQETETGVVLVDFFANWCNPCKALAVVIEQLASKDDSAVKYARVNVDESSRLAEKFGIMNIPTMVIFKNGEAVETVVGFRTENQLESIIKKFN